MGRRSFRSDNNAGLCPEALEALLAANDGSHVTGYGDDPWTERAVAAVRSVFEAPDAEVLFVATGTGANTLAIAALTEPWQRVLCHPQSHWAHHESTAPELLTHCRTQLVPTDAPRLRPGDIARAWPSPPGDVHEAQPGVLTLSNASELGLCYSPESLRALCNEAHEAGYRVHVDGARFANAVAHFGCGACELANAAGVDALSFGGTKNGLALGEAVVFFRQGDGAAFARAAERAPFLRKASAQLLSKHRFVTAPFALTLEGGAWLCHAERANRMAARLADACRKAGFPPAYDVDANHVLVALPEAVHAALRRAGHGYYGMGDPALGLARFVCSFDTREAEIDRLGTDLAQAAEDAGRPARP